MPRAISRIGRRPAVIEISLCVPTYNRKDILAEMLDALEEQTYPREKYQIVIADDASTDGTPEMVKGRVRSSECAIKYIRHARNSGVAAARNTTVRNADGRVLLFLDDDSLADNKLVETHMNAHAERGFRDIAVLGVDAGRLEAEPGPFGRYIERRAENFSGKIDEYISNGDERACFGFVTMNLSVKRELLSGGYVFDERFKYCEDTDLGYRLMRRGVKLVREKRAKVFNYHPLVLEDYAGLYRARGYYSALLEKKHPGIREAELFPFRRGRSPLDAVYPLVGKAVSIMDYALQVPFPEWLYERILYFYFDSGRRKALRIRDDEKRR
ncbi:MAG: glycosyltransferase [Candidatus Omnitrophica bacterium]|nr:glycosyltransferase [Candidatus Omnitrophota bacterium]